MVSSLTLSEEQKLIDTLSLHRVTKKAIISMIVINDLLDYHIPCSRHSLCFAWGSWGNKWWHSFSNSSFSMSRNVLVYLHFLSHISHMPPSKSSLINQKLMNFSRYNAWKMTEFQPEKLLQFSHKMCEISAKLPQKWIDSVPLIHSFFIAFSLVFQLSFNTKKLLF